VIAISFVDWVRGAVGMSNCVVRSFSPQKIFENSQLADLVASDKELVDVKSSAKKREVSPTW
jgi:hypothetical protein